MITVELLHLIQTCCLDFLPQSVFRPIFQQHLHSNLISCSTSAGNDFSVQAVRCGVDKEGGRRAVSDRRGSLGRWEEGRKAGQEGDQRFSFQSTLLSASRCFGTKGVRAPDVVTMATMMSKNKAVHVSKWFFFSRLKNFQKIIVFLLRCCWFDF